MRFASQTEMSEADKAVALRDAEALLSPEKASIRRRTFAYLDLKQASQAS